jgi:hypothetical protein
MSAVPLSSFDRFVSERGLSHAEIHAFIAFIGRTYDGPLYTRTRAELWAFFRAWKRSK